MIETKCLRDVQGRNPKGISLKNSEHVTANLDFCK